TWDEAYSGRGRSPITFVGELMRLRGWLEVCAELKLGPVDCWRAMREIGLHAPDAHVSRPSTEQARLVTRLTLIHTGRPNARLHPNDKWRLDQDRRCLAGDWGGYAA